MTGLMEKTGTRLCTAGDMDIVKTFECGQCFRWNAEGDSYVGVAGSRAARLWEDGGSVYISAEERDMPFWRSYFDMETDYAAARRSVELNDYLRECAEYGAGIRILRQERWEALCSFIISQCNNIPRIKGIVEKLCSIYGEEICFEGAIYHAFPAPEKLAELTPEDLAPLRSGYRAPYIINAARAVAEGRLDLESVASLPCGEARAALKELPGVGDKVANCAVLFGLHRMDAFPIDTWMKKALRAHFPPDFDPAALGEYAGLAQQYIFYHAREEE